MPHLAAALRVNYTPTLIFLDEQGKMALRLNGYYPPDEFRLALEYVAGHQETETGFTDYLAARAGAASGKLNWAQPVVCRRPLHPRCCA